MPNRIRRPGIAGGFVENENGGPATRPGRAGGFVVSPPPFVAATRPGIAGGFVGTPDPVAPDPVKQPIPSRRRTDDDVDSRLRRAGAVGRQSTIMTSAQGVLGGTTIAVKTLLGD